jgi:hypothetical protein
LKIVQFKILLPFSSKNCPIEKFSSKLTYVPGLFLKGWGFFS